jgi:hypothetical protein
MCAPDPRPAPRSRQLAARPIGRQLDLHQPHEFTDAQAKRMIEHSNFDDNHRAPMNILVSVLILFGSFSLSKSLGQRVFGTAEENAYRNCVSLDPANTQACDQHLPNIPRPAP